MSLSCHQECHQETSTFTLKSWPAGHLPGHLTRLVSRWLMGRWGNWGSHVPCPVRNKCVDFGSLALPSKPGSTTRRLIRWQLSSLGGVKTITQHPDYFSASSAWASRHMPTADLAKYGLSAGFPCVPSAIYNLNMETLTRSSWCHRVTISLKKMTSNLYYYFGFFWLHCKACGILVPH